MRAIIFFNKKMLLIGCISVAVLVFWDNARAVAACSTKLSVVNAIGEFEKQGLNVFYTSDQIKAWMKVRNQKVGSDPVEQLRTILESYSLRLERGPNSYWVVARDISKSYAGHGAISGRIISEVDGSPVNPAVVKVKNTDLYTLTIKNGCYFIYGLAPGHYDIQVSAGGYKPKFIPRIWVDNDETRFDISLDESPITVLDDMTVIGSHHRLIGDEMSNGYVLGKNEIEAMPNVANDIGRAMHRFPGIAMSDFSSKMHVRGGDTHETGVILDGLELNSPYHLQILGNTLSVVDSNTIAAAELMSGGYTADYGDRMSGIVNIETQDPLYANYQTRLGINHLNVYGMKQSMLENGQGGWLFSLRQNSSDYPQEWLVSNVKPNIVVVPLIESEIDSTDYFDIFVKFNYHLSNQHRLAAHIFRSGNRVSFYQHNYQFRISTSPGTGNGNPTLGNTDPDNLDFISINPKPSDLNVSDSRTSDNNIWLTVDSEWGDYLSSKSMVSYQNTNNRYLKTSGFISNFVPPPSRILEENVFITVDSGNSLNQSRSIYSNGSIISEYGIKSDWLYHHSDNQLFKWGLSMNNEKLDVSDIAFRDQNTQPNDHMDSKVHSAYFAYRYRVYDRITTELGVRSDKQIIEDQVKTVRNKLVSSRINFVYEMGRDTEIRVAWGDFYQPVHFSDEVIIASLGQSNASSATMPFLSNKPRYAMHKIIGITHHFSSLMNVRVDLYQKDSDNLGRNFVGRLNPYAVPSQVVGFKDLTGAYSEGIEISLTKKHLNYSWWLNYSISEAIEISDQQVVSRYWHQDESVNVGASWVKGLWRIYVTGVYHSGWPNPLAGSVVPSRRDDPVNNPFDIPYYLVNGIEEIILPDNFDFQGQNENLPSYSRLDMRFNYNVYTQDGKLSLYLNIFNVLDRKNQCCFDSLVKDGNRYKPVYKDLVGKSLSLGLLLEF